MENDPLHKLIQAMRLGYELAEQLPEREASDLTDCMPSAFGITDLLEGEAFSLGFNKGITTLYVTSEAADA